MTYLKLEKSIEIKESQSEDFYQLESLVEIILEDLRKRKARLRKKKSYSFKK